MSLWVAWFSEHLFNNASRSKFLFIHISVTGTVKPGKNGSKSYKNTHNNGFLLVTWHKLLIISICGNFICYTTCEQKHSCGIYKYYSKVMRKDIIGFGWVLDWVRKQTWAVLKILWMDLKPSNTQKTRILCHVEKPKTFISALLIATLQSDMSHAENSFTSQA